MKPRDTVVKKIVKMEVSINLPEEQDHTEHIIFILVKSELCFYISCWVVDGGGRCFKLVAFSTLFPT